MEFSLEHRTAQLSVGEFSEFQVGPRESGDGPQGIWRAQLGTHWHQEFRGRLGAENTEALFEIPLTGAVAHRGWTITLSGRIDQLLPPRGPAGNPRVRPAATLRELKTVLRPLPATEEELRAEYPSYFAQLSTYLALARIHAPVHPALAPDTPVHGELVFIEASSGISQTIATTAADLSAFTVQLERLTEFLSLRLRARERLSSLSFRPAFAQLRPGQETAHADLLAHVRERRVVFFEAPTGFGKTGVMLETALNELREGRYERVLYLTSKSTGQIQVVRQLAAMTQNPPSPGSGPAPGSNGLAAWHVRNKREHCVNTSFHCVRDTCRFLHDLEDKWARSDLARFYRVDGTDRSLDAVREAGASAGICPYEIMRVALAFQDVWIGDYNYVFAPGNRGLFSEQPGFAAARTLLIVDEAHNLPSRVADAYSHSFSAGDAALVAQGLYHSRAYAPLLSAWDHWTRFLQSLRPSDALGADGEDDARHLLDAVARHLAAVPVDHADLGPQVSEMLWQVPSLLNQLDLELPRLWWTPRAGELSITCLDAAQAIGPTLRSYGTSLLASATFGPPDVFAAACGLDPVGRPVQKAEAPGRLGTLNKRVTKKLFRQLSTGADLLQVEEARAADEPALVRAPTPWRDNAYDVAVDVRVDTTYQQRARFHALTAETIETLCAAGSGPARCIAAFFPSYSYAEAILAELDQRGSTLRCSLQPRLADLAAQQSWVEESLTLSDALFLVLGSSFAEGIDVLGGRVGCAMVVGPALPEVNAVQRARLATFSGLGREAAFRRVYQVPGIQKVNQALGRLVRAPGQRARVLLHCRRFAEPDYGSLLAREYQLGRHIDGPEALRAWLRPAPADPAT